MSPNTQRINTAYILIGLNLLLMLSLVVTLVYVSDLRTKVEKTNAQTRASCNRGNMARAQINTNSGVLQSSLAQAAQVWEQTAALAEARGESTAARVYRDAAAGYRSLMSVFTPLKLPDCDSIYP